MTWKPISYRNYLSLQDAIRRADEDGRLHEDLSLEDFPINFDEYSALTGDDYASVWFRGPSPHAVLLLQEHDDSFAAIDLLSGRLAQTTDPKYVGKIFTGRLLPIRSTSDPERFTGSSEEKEVYGCEYNFRSMLSQLRAHFEMPLLLPVHSSETKLCELLAAEGFEKYTDLTFPSDPSIDLGIYAINTGIARDDGEI